MLPQTNDYTAVGLKTRVYSSKNLSFQPERSIGNSDCSGFGKMERPRQIVPDQGQFPSLPLMRLELEILLLGNCVVRK